MKDEFTKSWIIEKSLRIVRRYEKGVLTLRALHYQLVSQGMTNTVQHYKRVVNAMIDARWEGSISFNTFSDLDREMVGETEFEPTDVISRFEKISDSIEFWMNNYFKNRWENQPYYPEIFIEKKALQGVFKEVCSDWDIALGACKGYPSLTFLYESSKRFKRAESEGKKPIILYFGDYDPSGEDIPRSIEENLERFGVSVEIRRIALMEDQVIEMELPPAPAKDTDSRSAKWTGLGQVELDAIPPETLISMCNEAIKEIFDADLYSDLMKQQEYESKEYKQKMRDFINNLNDE